MAAATAEVTGSSGSCGQGSFIHALDAKRLKRRRVVPDGGMSESRTLGSCSPAHALPRDRARPCRPARCREIPTQAAQQALGGSRVVRHH